MSKLFMMVGIVASGKSFHAQRLSKEHNAVILSSDDMREELFDDVDNQNDNDVVFKELHNKIIENLKNGKNVIYDATNLNYKRRKVFLDTLKKIDCERYAVVIATPYENCLKQNKQRERNVPDHVIRKMYLNFNMPQKYEGFDNIQVIYNFNKEDYSKEKLIDLFDRLDKIDQDNPNHKLTIGKHCNKVMENLLMMYNHSGKTENANLIVAGKLHDIGKEFTKSFTNSKGETTNIAHYYNHQNVSVYDCLFWLYEKSLEDRLEILVYIQHHMQPHFMETEKSKNKFLKLVGQKFYDEIMILHEADKNGVAADNKQDTKKTNIFFQTIKDTIKSIIPNKPKNEPKYADEYKRKSHDRQLSDGRIVKVKGAIIKKNN